MVNKVNLKIFCTAFYDWNLISVLKNQAIFLLYEGFSYVFIYLLNECGANSILI